MIRFLDLKKVNQKYKDVFLKKTEEVLDSGWFINGENCRLFEQEFAEYCGTKHAVGVGNGLDALSLILQAYIILGKLSEGDEVIVPSNTYIATILSITQNKLVPKLVEPDASTFNLDPKKVVSNITGKTKAILCVHLYRQLCDVNALKKISDEHNLLLIEDSAQAHGANLNMVKAGAFGNASAFSFYPGKNLGAIGDGGAVTTNDDQLSHVVRSLGNYGGTEKYKNELKGVNSRLDELQAGFLRVKLSYLDSEIKERQKISQHYKNLIKNPKILLPEVASCNNENSHVWHLFVVKTNFREDLQRYLFDSGVETVIHYPIPPHKQNAYKELNELNLPISEKIHKTVLSLPLYPGMSLLDVEAVSDCLNRFKA